ncbi:hypothetical protein PO909_019917 [Leuciscus waleckii]
MLEFMCRAPAFRPRVCLGNVTPLTITASFNTLAVTKEVTTVFATKLKSFTFVPLLKRLPVENRIWKKVLQAGRPNQGRSQLKEIRTSREPGDFEKSMAEEGVYKAEVIYVQDPEELGETLKNTTESEIQSTDNLTLKPPTTLVGPHAESGSITPAMETTVNKHPGISHLGFHNTAEVSSGLFLNSASQREEALSPASSMDFLTSPASSKESILSEGWDKERSWSALHMFSRDGSPGPFSRTVSPCSSVRSGTFTPSVSYSLTLSSFAPCPAQDSSNPTLPANGNPQERPSTCPVLFISKTVHALLAHQSS